MKLFLCRSCKGLFILDCQVEKHVKNCNGDAFKSPANLFACEREHFLELLALGARNTATDDTSLVSSFKRKRRKSTPQTNYDAESHATGDSLWNRGNETSRLSTSFVGMGTVQLLKDDQFSNTQTNKISRSRSQPLINPLQKSIMHTDSEAVQCCVPDNVFSNEISLPVTISHSQTQPFTATFTEGTNAVACDSPSHAETDRPTSFPSNVNEQAYKDLSCSDSDTDMIQKTGTPATNLLAFLSKLQQGAESTASQATGQQGQAVNIAVRENCLQGSFSTNTNNACYSVENHSIAQTSESESQLLKDFADETSVHAVGDNDVSDQQLEQSIIEGELVEDDNFQFRAVGTFNTFSETNYVVRSEGTKSCLTEHEPLPTYSNVRMNGNETRNCEAKVTHRAEQSGTSNSEGTDITSENDCMEIQEDGNQAPDLENTKEVDLYHCQTQSDCPSLTTQGVGATWSSTGGKTLPKVDSTVQGPVLYILEPDTLQNIAVEDTATGEGETVNNSFVLPVDLGPEDLVVDHSSVAVRDTLTVNVTSSPSSLGGSPSEPVQVYVTVADNVVRSDNTVHKGKSKHQLRLEEQKALREKVLQQSTEVPPDAESNKTRYRCNICGHVAMSIKFMYNHQQVKNMIH